MRDGKVRPISMRMIGGPLDDQVVLYLIDYEFAGRVVVPLMGGGELTGKAAVYDMLQGLDEEGNILMSFTEIIDSPDATVLNEGKDDNSN